jgi:DNA-binding transcriptional MerR regulator
MAIYSLRDLAVEAGLSYHTVYYYMKEGLLSEASMVGSRQRVFGDAELHALKRIVALRRSGKAISEIRELLQSEPVDERTQHL